LETIHFIDQTLRDAHQSLWGMRMRPREVLPVASLIDSVGFRVVDLAGWSHFVVRIREFGENPWESLDLISAAIPKSRLRAGSATSSIAVFNFTPRVLMELSIQLNVRHGIGSYWILDCLYNLDKMENLCRTTKEAGAEAVPAIMYSLSPVHTDEYFASKVRAMASWGCVDAICIEDASGVLTPDRVRTLIPALTLAADGIPLELHCHNNTGLAPACYMEGIRHGIRILHTATKSLANGPSLPATETMLDNVVRSGYSVDIDPSPLAEISDHFEWVALREGYPTGVLSDYHVFNYEHQLPGGMTGTLRNQLRKHGMEDRLAATLDEIIIVRKELGYPVMASPFSQFVGIQSLLNVTLGERYAAVPDETIMYLLGLFGEIPGSPDPDVVDKIMSSKRAQQLQSWTPPEPTLDEVRQRLGRSLSDEDLLLSALVEEDELKKMRGAGPVSTTFPNPVRDVVGLIKRLASDTDWQRVDIDDSGLSLTLARSRVH